MQGGGGGKPEWGDFNRFPAAIQGHLRARQGIVPYADILTWFRCTVFWISVSYSLSQLWEAGNCRKKLSKLEELIRQSADPGRKKVGKLFSRETNRAPLSVCPIHFDRKTWKKITKKFNPHRAVGVAWREERETTIAVVDWKRMEAGKKEAAAS